MLTEALLRKQTGQYDPEIMTRLKLERLGLMRIASLERCTNLIELNLAWNDISEISGLDGLGFLKRLDLSHNRIERIENLDGLESLEWLDLRFNRISSIDDVHHLSDCSRLKSLWLRAPTGETNPAANHASYAALITQALPALEILDGGHLSLIEASAAFEKYLDGIRPSEAATKTPPPEPWYSPQDLELGKASEEADPSQAQIFAPLHDSHDRILEMLSQECAYLLRNAGSTLARAKQP